MINYMSNGKVMIINFIFVLIKKISLYKMSYFPEPYTRTKKKKVELGLSKYAIKSDWKSATDISWYCWYSGIKSGIDDLDIDKLKTDPVDLYIN